MTKDCVRRLQEIAALVFASLALPIVLAAPMAFAQGGCDGDFNGDGVVTIEEIIVAVNNALKDCPEAPTPTPGSGRFVDNRDGTITDATTGLVWEKKSDDGGIHDKDNYYNWSASLPDANGMAFTVFVVGLNTSPCFANHCDWRLPTLTELEGLIDHEHTNPAIDPAFNTGCAPTCTVTHCSCIRLAGNVCYWSSTSSATDTNNAGTVCFGVGTSGYDSKLHTNYVRAVRQGS